MIMARSGPIRRKLECSIELETGAAVSPTPQMLLTFARCLCDDAGSSCILGRSVSRLPPIFEMNLPEGVLRERLRLAFAKATGTFDEFDLLGVVGRSQVGRIRYTGQREQLQEDVPFQSVDEILEHRRGGDLFRYLNIEKFATFSGISGVQPKILGERRSRILRLSMVFLVQRFSESYRGATHIVKFWDQNEYPQLAANEYFCLEVAKACGLEVPSYRLSEDATALVIDRFDLQPSDGNFTGVSKISAY